MPYYPQGPQESPKKQAPKGLILFRRFLLCLSVLLIAYGICRLAGYGIDWAFSRLTTRELREIAQATEPAAVPAPETAAAAAATPVPTAAPSPDPTAVPAVAPGSPWTAWMNR